MRMKTALLLLSAALLAGWGASCSLSPAPWEMEHKDVNTLVFVYMAGRNNLTYSMLCDMQEMESYVSNLRKTGNDVVVFAAMPSATNETGLTNEGIYYWPDYSVYTNWNYTIPHYVLPVLIDNMKGRNTGDPQTLIDALKFVNANFSYGKIALVLWNHGSAFFPMGQNYTISNDVEPYRGVHAPIVHQQAVAYDELYEDSLSEEEVAYAIGRAMPSGKVDVLAYDACTMGTLEVLYTIRHSADWIVAEPNIVAWDGYPYHKILSNLCISSGSSLEVAKAFVNAYNDDWAVYTNTKGLPYHYTSAIKAPEAIDATVKILDDLVVYACTNGEKEILMQLARGKSPTYYAENEYGFGTDFANILSKMNVLNYFADSFTNDYSSFSNRYALLVNDPSMMYWTYKPTLSYLEFGRYSFYDGNTLLENYYNPQYVKLFADDTNVYLILKEIQFDTNEFPAYTNVTYYGLKGSIWTNATYPKE